MRFLSALLLLAQVVTYPPGRPAATTYPQQPAGVSVPPCAEIGVPFIGAENGRAVGYEYAFPILPFFAPNPPTHRNPTSIGAGPDFNVGNAYVDFGAIDNTTRIQPWDINDTGVNMLAIWANNCFGGGIAGGALSQANVYDTGWATGEPKLLNVISLYVALDEMTDPISVNLADLIAWQEDTVSVVITDTNTSNVVYSGAYSASMINNTDYTCAYYNAYGPNAPLDIVATNATGSMSLPAILQLQDIYALCGGPG